MALTDPELDLLRELLEDDPEDDVYLQVGRELVRRAQWSEATSVLAGGMGSGKGEPEGWSLLARASLESGSLDIANAALGKMDPDPTRNPADAALAILILEASGRHEVARTAIAEFLAVEPNDVVVQAALDRLDAPAVAAAVIRTPDPFVSLDRAERYVTVGRQDRAVRVYRRLVYHNPENAAIRTRLRQLMANDEAFFQDDLSEELEDPRAVPPDFQMPLPSLSAVAAADEEITEPGRRLAEVSDSVRQFAKGKGKKENPLPGEFDADEEDTDTLTVLRDENGEIAKVARKRTRRRRRSLINR